MVKRHRVVRTAGHSRGKRLAGTKVNPASSQAVQVVPVDSPAARVGMAKDRVWAPEVRVVKAWVLAVSGVDRGGLAGRVWGRAVPETKDSKWVPAKRN